MALTKPAVAEVSGDFVISVTRARVRACNAHKGEPDTSDTPSIPVSGKSTQVSPPKTSIAGSAAHLALDLGSRTGWALRSPSGIITSGVTLFRPSRYDGGGIRYLRFRAWLDQQFDQHGDIGAVHFEAVRRHAGTDAAHAYGGFLAILSAWCEHHGIAYQGVPVGTIKRFIAGKGNADKQAVVAAVRSRGFNPADDNEADALAILLWAIEAQGGVR